MQAWTLSGNFETNGLLRCWRNCRNPANIRTTRDALRSHIRRVSRSQPFPCKHGRCRGTLKPTACSVAGATVAILRIFGFPILAKQVSPSSYSASFKVAALPMQAWTLSGNFETNGLLRCWRNCRNPANIRIPDPCKASLSILIFGEFQGIILFRASTRV